MMIPQTNQTPDPTCLDCDGPISPKRREALPDTRWCVTCAERHVVKVGGNMIWSSGKHAPELEIKSGPAAREWARRYNRRRATASIGVGSYAAAQDAKAGVSRFGGN